MKAGYYPVDKSIHQTIESKFCSHLNEIAFAEIFVCWCWSTRFPACTGLSLAATNKFSLNAHNNTFISIDQVPYSNVALKISLFTWGAEGRQSPMAGEMVLAGTTTLKYSPHIAHKSSSKLYRELFSFKDEIEHSWVPYTESFHYYNCWHFPFLVFTLTFLVRYFVCSDFFFNLSQTLALVDKTTIDKVFFGTMIIV